MRQFCILHAASHMLVRYVRYFPPAITRTNTSVHARPRCFSATAPWLPASMKQSCCTSNAGGCQGTASTAAGAAWHWAAAVPMHHAGGETQHHHAIREPGVCHTGASTLQYDACFSYDLQRTGIPHCLLRRVNALPTWRVGVLFTGGGCVVQFFPDGCPA